MASRLSLIVALALSVAQGVLPLVGAQRNKPDWMTLARPLAHWQTLFIMAAFVLLSVSFVSRIRMPWVCSIEGRNDEFRISE